ncbi:MAG TPA: hypothetical protein VFT22_09020 [Kofleriaceae bacterium]|nr:hypothetical protein [Kofleriaceae bacterium]
MHPIGCLTLAVTSTALFAVPTAYAQPSLAEPAPEVREGPSITSFVEAGAAAGFTQTDLYGALQLDGGHRLVGPLWLHARLARADTATIHVAGSDPPSLSSFTEARLGLELRGCRRDGRICLVGGVDAGYVAETYDRPVDLPGSDATATGRVGLDFGGSNLRMRTSVEGGRGLDNWRIGGLTIGLAYGW